MSNVDADLIISLCRQRLAPSTDQGGIRWGGGMIQGCIASTYIHVVGVYTTGKFNVTPDGLHYETCKAM